MASKYPAALDNLPTNRTDTTPLTTTHPSDHNNAADAVNKIESELGTNPSGSYATLAARLDALQAKLG